jgi:exosortase
MALGVAFLAFALAYGEVFASLVTDWATDDNYSHGFLILPFALFFAWERRARLAAAIPAPAWSGLAMLVGGLVLLLVGLLGAERFLTRISMLLSLAGALVFVRGWSTARVVAFPLAFLLLMIPIPVIIFNQVAFPLQLLASRVGEQMLAALSIPVLREGNLIVLAHTTLEVAEACSGIRSLVSLLTLGIIYGYFVDSRGIVRFVVATATVPIAILANGLRVAGTGAAAHRFGPEAAEGFFHSFSGWLMFAASFVLLFVFAQALLRAFPTPPTAGSRAVRA